MNYSKNLTKESIEELEAKKEKIFVEIGKMEVQKHYYEQKIHMLLMEIDIINDYLCGRIGVAGIDNRRDHLHTFFASDENGEPQRHAVRQIPRPHDPARRSQGKICRCGGGG